MAEFLQRNSATLRIVKTDLIKANATEQVHDSVTSYCVIHFHFLKQILTQVVKMTFTVLLMLNADLFAGDIVN